MTKAEKFELVKELTEDFRENPNFYVLDIGGMSVAANNDLRRKLFENGLKLRMVKNTLLKKALENLESESDSLHPALVQSSSLIFIEGKPSDPAKVLKEFRGKDGELPRLKAAYIDSAVYLGDDQLEPLTNLKSKEDLIAELVSLLQSPAKNVVSQLQSGGQKLSGLIKALSEGAE